MQAVVIDINQAEAYLALPDGTNLNVAVTHLPATIKAGEKIHLNPGSPSVTNCRINGLL